MAARLALFSLLASLAAACASSPSAQVEEVDKVAACVDSQEAGCDNGLPLCMMDEERACRMCRCSAYAMQQRLGAPVGTLPMGPASAAMYEPFNKALP